MDQLDRLPEVTEHVLSGLKADHRLKQRILESAVSAPRKMPLRRGTVIALCSLSLLLILLCVFVSGLSGKSSGDISVIPAGSRRNSSPVSLETVVEKASDLMQEELPETESP